MAKGMSKGTKQLLVVIIVIVAVFMIAQGGRAPAPASTTGPSGTTLPTGDVGFTGPATITSAHFDSLDISTGRTEATNVVTTWLQYRNGQWKSVATGSSGTFNVDTSDGGFVYAMFAPASGQTYYFDSAKTLDINRPRITEILFVDATGIGTRNFVAKIKVSDLGMKAGQTAAAASIVAYWYTYEAIALNSPADQTSIGTVAGTVKTIQWQTTFTNTKRAIAEYKVQLKFNSTSDTKWDLAESKLNVPNVGLLPISQFVKTTDGTNTYYDYTFGSNLKDAVYITLVNDGINRFAWDLKLKLSLATSDKIGVTLTITPLATTGSAGSSITDTVGLAA